MRHQLRLIALSALVVLLVSCGLGLPASLDPPSELSATTDQVEQITVSWTGVKGADRYYIYRSESATGPFWTEGEYGPIPYATVTGTSFIDSPLDPLTLFYRVTAVQQYTGAESPPSEIATGTSVSGPLEWKDPATVSGFFTTFATLRVAVDWQGSTTRGYLLTVPDETSAAIAVRRIAVDGSLSVVGSSFATVDGTDARVADVAVVDGSVYVAAVDEADDTVGLWLFESGGSAFTPLTTGLAAAHPTSPLVSIAAQSAAAVWIAYRAADGSLALYNHDGVTATPLSAPTGFDSTNNTTLVIGDLALSASDSVLYMTAELQTLSGDTDSLGVSEWSGSAWGAADVIDSGRIGNVTAMAAAVDLASNTLYVTHDDDNGISVRELAGNVVAASSDGDFAGTPAADAPIGMAADDGTLYLFYEDATAGSGTVRAFDTSGGTWAEFSPADFTQGDDLETAAATAANGRLFTGWIRNGSAVTRSYQ